MSTNAFGYVEIKDGMVVCYTGDSRNPTIHKFENDEFLEWKKKADLYDALGDIIKQVNDLLNKNRELEKKLKCYTEPFEMRPTYQVLEKELRKYQILQYTPKELEIELNKGILKTLTLEKIEELEEKFGGLNHATFRTALRKILKDHK